MNKTIKIEIGNRVQEFYNVMEGEMVVITVYKKEEEVEFKRTINI